MVRAEQGGNDVLYSTVAIGALVRFYFLNPSEQDMIDHPFVATISPYELEKDEAINHEI